GLGADPALLLLHDREARHHGRLLLLGRILGDLACEAGLGAVGEVEAHRSTSPNTMSIVPMIATASAIMWPRLISSSADRCAKPGARIFMRYGLLAPSL